VVPTSEANIGFYLSVHNGLDATGVGSGDSDRLSQGDGVTLQVQDLIEGGTGEPWC
jgi:hypothetical protein